MARVSPRKPQIHKKPPASAAPLSQADLKIAAQKDLYFNLGVAAILLALGIYISILLFGFQLVPTADFAAFVGVAEHLLHGSLPTDLKRGPVLGLLVLPLSKIVGTSSPELTAGWLLNACLYTANFLLLWRIAARFIGTAAVWFALIAMLNPWTIQSLIDPIAETTMMFFTLLTVFAIIKRSRLSYVAAALASMVRYECSALILAAFLIDFFENRDISKRLFACLYLVLASLPFAFWMFETFMRWNSQEPTHYLKVFTPAFTTMDSGAPDRVGLFKHLHVLWMVGFSHLALPDPRASAGVNDLLQFLNEALVVIAFAFGVFWGIVKRNWNLAILLVFFVPYVVVHCRYPYMLPRYYQSVYWIALLTCCYGLASAWKILTSRVNIPVPIVVSLQVFLLVVAALWINQLWPYLDTLSEICPRGASIPYGAGAAIVAILLLFTWRFPGRRAFTALTTAALAALVVISGQFAIAQSLGDGLRDAEFKELAGWYVKNTMPGEKIAVYMQGTVKYYTPPQRRDDVCGLVAAPTEQEFLAKCARQGIRYLVYGSREGVNSENEYYKLNGLDHVAPLAQPRDIGPYHFVTRVDGKYGYVHVFRIDANQPNLK